MSVPGSGIDRLGRPQGAERSIGVSRQPRWPAARSNGRAPAGAATRAGIFTSANARCGRGSRAASCPGHSKRAARPPGFSRVQACLFARNGARIAVSPDRAALAAVATMMQRCPRQTTPSTTSRPPAAPSPLWPARCARARSRAGRAATARPPTPDAAPRQPPLDRRAARSRRDLLALRAHRRGHRDLQRAAARRWSPTAIRKAWAGAISCWR